MIWIMKNNIIIVNYLCYSIHQDYENQKEKSQRSDLIEQLQAYKKGSWLG